MAHTESLLVKREIIGVGCLRGESTRRLVIVVGDHNKWVPKQPITLSQARKHAWDRPAETSDPAPAIGRLAWADRSAAPLTAAGELRLRPRVAAKKRNRGEFITFP